MEDSPLNEGRVCAKALAAKEMLYHPDRLKHPMKREGETWRRISWEEALNVIAAELKSLKERHGAESLACIPGVIEMRTVDPFIQRFMNVFGTPNLGAMSELCVGPKVMADLLTFGAQAFRSRDIRKSRCIVLWGFNPPASNPVSWEDFSEAKRKGAKLIVIDPRTTTAGAKADLHLQLLPGTDGALALGMLNVIIGEKLYDEEFVKRWTSGFDKLKEHVKAYQPKEVEEITTVPAGIIEEAARAYATLKPAYMELGNALDVTRDSFQTLRATAILRAITGNLDVPGGNVFDHGLRLADISLSERLPSGSKPLGAERYPLHTLMLGSVPSGTLIRAILEGKRRTIRAAIVDYCNPALTWCETEKTVEAFKKLDFLVVIDVFMSETARLADIVLPAATFLETPRLYTYGGDVLGDGGAGSYAMWGIKAVEPAEECWPDWKFWFELAKKMGYHDEFPWDSIEEAVDMQLQPTGLTVAELERHPSGILCGPALRYRSYEENGFSTPYGKVELYSEVLHKYGYDALPVISNLAETSGQDASDFPLLLTTGAKSLAYSHSSWRQLSSLRATMPEPLAEIHYRTARERGIADGEFVLIRTRKGSIRMKARLTDDIHPRCVSIPHGWEEANCNALTDLDEVDPVTGSPNFRAIQCRVTREA
jgi:anaerobic selenocysteine-containing dehydrogenase